MKTYIILILTAALFIRCSNSPENGIVIENTHDQSAVTISLDQAKEIGLTLGTMSVVLVEESIDAIGRLDLPPQNRIRLTSPINGIVMNIYVLEGQRVNKNETIVKIGGNDFIKLQESYKLLKSRIPYLREEFNRQKSLRAENVNAAKTLALAETEFTEATIKLSSLEAQFSLLNVSVDQLNSSKILKNFTLMSPMESIITKMEIIQGDYVKPGQLLFEAINKDHLHLELKVFESDILKVKVGQKVKFVIPSLSVSTLHGEVFLVNAVIDEYNKVNVHVHIDEEDHGPNSFSFENSILPGMYAEANIIVASSRKRAISDEGISSKEGRNYIYIKKYQTDSTLTFDVIEIFEDENNIPIIPENLPEDASVVTKGAYYLFDAWKSEK